MELSQIKVGVEVKDEYDNKFVVVSRYIKPFGRFDLLCLEGDIKNRLLHCLDWDAGGFKVLPKEPDQN